MKKFLSAVLLLIVCISVFSLTVSARDVSREETLAGELKTLGIFYGVSETNFDLEREPTRVEAVVMLIRVLGKEAEALDGTWRHPFTDVPAWADNYIGYAYSKGLANGVDYTRFGASEKATSAMYLTFVLRALGYSDTNGADFVWNNPYTLAKTAGILPSTVDTETFWRADVVLVSHAALESYLKGTKTPLYEKLISAGVFTLAEFNTTYKKSGSTPVTGGELDAEEIYQKCSPAVFYIEVYDKNGSALGSGSGFFIDLNGTAVTNHHVIEDAYSAKIQLSDTGRVYNVLGVYDYSEANDWAVIKVDVKNTSCLKIGDPATAIGGAKVYAIGSPEGLQNTISEGLISNPSRMIGTTEYIQISAPISHGSSGGALFNKFGEVIGITSAGLEEGQNLNFVIPMTALAGYRKTSVTPLSQVQTSSTPTPVENAYSTLAALIVKNKTGYDEELGHEFNFTSDDDTESVSIYYNDKEGTILVSLAYIFDDTALGYSFGMSKNYEGLTYSLYRMYSYNSKTDSFEPISEGTSFVYNADFHEGYKYAFEEYSGSSRADDERYAKLLHSDVLDFINLFYNACGSSYTVRDLGYSAYAPFKESAGSGVAITPSSVSVEAGASVVASFNCTDPEIEYATFTIKSDNESIATVKWTDLDDDDFPWDITVTGVSAGTTKIRITNDKNSAVAELTVTVTAPKAGQSLAPSRVSVKRGGVAYATFDCTDSKYDYATFTVESMNEGIADVEWADMDDDTLPWDIKITGISKGTTTVRITNDVDSSYVAITVTVN